MLIPETLDKLEKRIRALIEGQLVALLPGQTPQELLANQLISAISDGITAPEGGTPNIPNVYTLLVHPDSLAGWQSDPKLIETIVAIVNIAADDAGLQLETRPSISIAGDVALGPNEVRVLASHSMENIAETKGTPSGDNPEDSQTLPMPSNAFLIVDGVKVFPLDKPVINIGRRMDNHLVIDDPRVSRNHVQLRSIKGRFVLFDLNSTGGTYVNGQRANQTVLYPGDVISMAGVPLIFGQDNPPPRTDRMTTAPLSP
ncbi:MAG: FHA domain-containing protein, partial [Chloroflexota bacterium]